MRVWDYEVTAQLTSEDLARYGDEGWELVSVEWDGAAIRAAVLKRPKTLDEDAAGDELA